MLESGLDGVLLRTEDPDDAIALSQFLVGREQLKLPLVPAVVTRVTPVGCVNQLSRAFAVA